MQNNKEKISPMVIRRLPRYRRYLADLENRGVERVSSGMLSEILGYTASQIRQDLNNFGGFGQQGYGYKVSDLKTEIDAILGLGEQYRMAIVGIGNLGHAVSNYLYRYLDEFVVAALFDVNPAVIGSEIAGIEIRNANELDAYLAENAIDIGVITANKEAAQGIADSFIKGGVRGIWNFATIDIDVPDEICLQNEHLSDGLHELVYYIHSK
ncbi:MAG: redox-sensing transcriptional repressor Rex [Clostridiales Family XIII bacterium]|jgi:redox-sensing transcriptional repressor|nr:redox-sensing transcriptional repressor Rex [Clostridiales Family XIII bacterium]